MPQDINNLMEKYIRLSNVLFVTIKLKQYMLEIFYLYVIGGHKPYLGDDSHLILVFLCSVDHFSNEYT